MRAAACSSSMHAWWWNKCCAGLCAAHPSAASAPRSRCPGRAPSSRPNCPLLKNAGIRPVPKVAARRRAGRAPCQAARRSRRRRWQLLRKQHVRGSGGRRAAACAHALCIGGRGAGRVGSGPTGGGALRCASARGKLGGRGLAVGARTATRRAAAAVAGGVVATGAAGVGDTRHGSGRGRAGPPGPARRRGGAGFGYSAE